MSCAVLRRNAAWARANMQMSADEFYALTPAEFQRAYTSWLLTQRRQDSWWAKLCHVVATSAGAKLSNGEDIPFDFFAPWYRPKRSRLSPINQLLAILPEERIIDNRKKKPRK